MSFYFRDKLKFGDRLRGKSGDELLQEIKQQMDEVSKPSSRTGGRDPSERHTIFPRGFPFDDEGFGRRGDIRAHLDDLAARHPEFADHLLGPPWGDIPFHGTTFRNRNHRGSGGNGVGNNSYQGFSDEDARSQASGSSAASGASAVSSHGEPEGNQERSSRQNEQYTTTGRSQIPQYGLRNTVDIGQHQHNMENPEKGNRGQRSMSAPPENRQFSSPSGQKQPAPRQEQQNQQPQGGQRYVSRIDITPQHNQPQQQQQPQQHQPSQQQQKSPQQPSNVRHIPIFVEGRDEPVLPRSSDEHFRREPSPTQFHTPPHFQRPSPFGQSSFGRSHQAWSPHFQDSFYPPLNSLAEQVKQYNGNSRKDKQYMYLDEMLTRELIKLDDIETEGRENVRQARRNAIKSIQETISFLESKVPLHSQPSTPVEVEKPEYSENDQAQTQPESMEVDQKQEESVKEPIPLPPGPSSPTKKSDEPEEKKPVDDCRPPSRQTDATSGEPMDTGPTETLDTPIDAQQTVEQANVPEEKTQKDTATVPEAIPLEEKNQIMNNSEPSTLDDSLDKVPEETSLRTETAAVNEDQKITEEPSKEKLEAIRPDERTSVEEKMQVDGNAKPVAKSLRKGKKSKKQTPVSDKPIPLPPPENTEASPK
ncbi:BAG domain-containing protein Samui [Dufourea novaeangliae]|uniref:BAG domain-containing protein Samui n=1 Tax=Dufourea novaeangliae TaxID=178035 RepID=A0A154PJW5_DUFNO|nr:BAG domain-containing protein Samui [Dufourea novaeangliae]